MVVGIASRKVPTHLPLVFSKYPGDVLWALLVFIIIGFLFNKMEILRVSLYSLAFSYLIEISQIYHAPWIDNIRHSLFGKLVLGSGFSVIDMICYTIGILIGAILEYYFIKRKNINAII